MVVIHSFRNKQIKNIFQVADITFNFWYRLSEALYQRNQPTLNEVFRPYVQRLIVALCRHCQFEPDHVSTPLRGLLGLTLYRVEMAGVETTGS